MAQLLRIRPQAAREACGSTFGSGKARRCSEAQRSAYGKGQGVVQSVKFSMGSTAE